MGGSVVGRRCRETELCMYHKHAPAAMPHNTRPHAACINRVLSQTAGAAPPHSWLAHIVVGGGGAQQVGCPGLQRRRLLPAQERQNGGQAAHAFQVCTD